LNGHELSYLDEIKKEILFGRQSTTTTYHRTIRAIKLNAFGDKVYMLTEDNRYKTPVSMQCCNLQGAKFVLVWEYVLEGVFRINPKGCSRPTLCVSEREDFVHMIVQAVPTDVDIQVKIDSEYDPKDLNLDNNAPKRKFRESVMKRYAAEDEICKNMKAKYYYIPVKQASLTKQFDIQKEVKK
jgi:hypothetical protein